MKKINSTVQKQGPASEELGNKVKDSLLKAIPATVKGAKIKDPVYCIALAYDGEGNGPLPPCLGLGLESERQQWRTEYGKEAKSMIWNPAEFKHYETDYTQLEDRELDKWSDQFNEMLAEKESDAPGIKLLNEVAAELAKMDWSKVLDVTPDFVVYAVDFELGHLKKNLKKSVDPKRLESLKKAGYL